MMIVNPLPLEQVENEFFSLDVRRVGIRVEKGGGGSLLRKWLFSLPKKVGRWIDCSTTREPVGKRAKADLPSPWHTIHLLLSLWTVAYQISTVHPKCNLRFRFKYVISKNHFRGKELVLISYVFHFQFSHKFQRQRLCYLLRAQGNFVEYL